MFFLCSVNNPLCYFVWHYTACGPPRDAICQQTVIGESIEDGQWFSLQDNPPKDPPEDLQTLELLSVLELHCEYVFMCTPRVWYPEALLSVLSELEKVVWSTMTMASSVDVIALYVNWSGSNVYGGSPMWCWTVFQHTLWPGVLEQLGHSCLDCQWWSF